MYLLIADRFKFEQDYRSHYVCAKEFYSSVVRIFPEIKTLNIKDIEGLFIYSNRKEHAEKKVLEIECKELRIEENVLNITYGVTAEIDVESKRFKNNLYGLLKRKGVLSENEAVPFVAVVDINEAYNLQGLNPPKIKAILDEIEDLKKRHKWIDIINYFGDINKIEELECWDNLLYLDEVVYALAKVSEPSSKVDAISRVKYQQIFFKAVQQSLTIKPNSQKIKSILAYHYYCVFMKEKKNDNGCYDKANELYLELMETSTDSFKEKYRYWKLQQTNFDIIKWTLEGLEWVKKVDEILAGFKYVIDDYVGLTEDNQKKRKKEYIGALYAYSVFALENKLRAWDLYVDEIIYSKAIPSYLFSEENLQIIIDVDKYIDEIIVIQKWEDKGTNIDLRTKPSFLDIYYRKAQIVQEKGIMHLLNKRTKEDSAQYFIQSNQYIDKLFKVAYEKKDKFNFLFPYHAKLPKAINDYFLNAESVHKNFNNAKPYMVYEQAVICYLQKDIEKALQVLATIPKKDKCFNKAEKLRKKIIDENK